jgi:AraC-like DNA-binding protein
MLDDTNLISRARLKQIVYELIRSGDSTIVSAAAYLGTSPRSLQRQVETLKLTYSEVVDEVRYELARELLAGRDLEIAKIGASLGYRDPSSFSRAFMRWSGICPRAYRNASCEADDAKNDRVVMARPADKVDGEISLSSRAQGRRR